MPSNSLDLVLSKVERLEERGRESESEEDLPEEQPQKTTSLSVAKKRKPTIVLDLDETLISSWGPYEKELTENWDRISRSGMKITCLYEKDEKTTAFYVFHRPHLEEFLDFLFRNFNVVVWTAATSDYACEVVEKVFKSPNGEPLVPYMILTRDHDEEARRQYGGSKDLRYIWRSSLPFVPEATFIVDNLDKVVNHQICHGYMADEFDATHLGAEKDTFLLRLKERLEKALRMGYPSGRSDCPLREVAQKTAIQ